MSRLSTSRPGRPSRRCSGERRGRRRIPVRLTLETVDEYLRDRDEVGSSVATVTALGGVSNAVLRVETEETRLVFKQPYQNLEVADDWPADVGRIHNEARTTGAYAVIIERAGNEHVSVPKVLVRGPRGARRGYRVRPCLGDGLEVSPARRMGRSRCRPLAGRTPGVVHRLSSEDDALRGAFANPTPFDQLRLEPDHRAVARRHPISQARFGPIGWRGSLNLSYPGVHCTNELLPRTDDAVSYPR